jgi:putative sigma-54 modulation protein
MNPTTFPVRIQARHLELTDALRQHIEAKVESLHGEGPRIVDAHVVLEVQKQQHRCEIVVTAANHVKFVVKHQSKDLYVSIDRSIDKLERLLRKHKNQVIQHRREYVKNIPNPHVRSAQACSCECKE